MASTPTPISGYSETKEGLSKARALNDSFFQVFNLETEKKNLLFINLRNKIKYKTEEAMKKIVENESKILIQVNNLESKFIECFQHFVHLERDAECKLNEWQSEISLNDSTSKIIHENIQNELISLENINEKFKQMTIKESDLDTIDFKIDEAFLNKLIEKNNVFTKESLEYQQLSARPKLSKVVFIFLFFFCILN